MTTMTTTHQAGLRPAQAPPRRPLKAGRYAPDSDERRLLGRSANPLPVRKPDLPGADAIRLPLQPPPSRRRQCTVAVEDKTVLEGDIISKWEVVDPTHYTFTMKPNVKWQNKAPMNGRAATAQDFVKTWDVFTKASPNAAKYNGIIDKVEAPDEKTIKMTLKAAFAPFLHAIAASAEGIWFIPTETIDSGQAKQDPVGTGPTSSAASPRGCPSSGTATRTTYDPRCRTSTRSKPASRTTPSASSPLSRRANSTSPPERANHKESRSKLDPKGGDIFVQSSVEGGLYFNFDNKPFTISASARRSR